MATRGRFDQGAVGRVVGRSGGRTHVRPKLSPPPRPAGPGAATVVELHRR